MAWFSYFNTANTSIDITPLDQNGQPIAPQFALAAGASVQMGPAAIPKFAVQQAGNVAVASTGTLQFFGDFASYVCQDARNEFIVTIIGSESGLTPIP